jgi:cation:H+ antiporter
MPALSLESTGVAVTLLVACSAVIVVVGPRMVAVADRLADVTGLGEAIVGAVLVGAATSLPDLFATITPAARGLADLAVGNALGGVLGQTAFLAVADLTYRRANLEHAAASLPNLLQGSLLLALLATVVLLIHGPQVDIAGVHPGTVVLLAMYGYGLRVTAEVSSRPMWRAVETAETRPDEPHEPPDHDAGKLRPLLARFAVFAVVLGVAGWLLGRSGETIAAATGLSETAVGVLLTGLSSSLAELVVAISAVRAGALTLAVGNVIGGNTFDTLLVGVADIAYRDGPVYAAVSAQQTFVSGMAILATAAILVGLLRRERHGVANIGMESVAVLALYGITVVIVAA